MSTRLRWPLAWIGALALLAAPLIGCTENTSTTKVERGVAPSLFESADGNLLTDGAPDWGTVAVSPDFFRLDDLASGSGDDSYGGGSKEDSIDPPWTYGSIPPNKSDLVRLYLFYEYTGGDHLLEFAWARTNRLGTANMSMELSQSPETTATGNPVRTEGDVLITFDWASGAHVVNLGALLWHEAGPCFANGSSPPCWGSYLDLTAAGYADGQVNDGFDVYDPIALETLGDKTFGEGSVNLSAAGLIPYDECVGFAQALLRSRSSDSFTAKTKDKIGPYPIEVDTCEPVTVKLKKVDPDGAPLADAVMALYLDEGDGVLGPGDTLIPNNVNGETTCVTAADGIGTCVFEIDEDVTVIGHEVTPPPGYTLGAPDQVLVIERTAEPQEITLTFTDQPAPGRIVIHKTDDADAPLVGVTFHLHADADPFGGAPGAEDGYAGKSCTTDATGVCALETVDPGTYWVVEDLTTVPAGRAAAEPPHQLVTVGLGTEPGVGQTVTVTFVNPIVPGRILIEKVDGDGAPLAGVTFDLYADAAPIGGTLGAEDTYAGKSCTTDAAGACAIEDVELGEYWVVENAATVPAGYFAVDPQHVTIGLGDAPGEGDEVALTFVNVAAPGRILILKVDPYGAPLAGAVFGLYADAEPLGGVFGAEDLFAGKACTTDATGSCAIESVDHGDYWVVETTVPAGYDGADPQHVTVGLGPSPGEGQTVELTFVNIPHEVSGCTPGFFKNHTELWDQPTDELAVAAGFTTASSFNAVLGLTEAESPFSDALTMDAAINLGGGDAYKLARHGVAALLNHATGYAYAYPGDAAALTAALHDAFVAADYEPLATDLMIANEKGCLLD